MDSCPLVSVVIPVFNPGKYFKACLDSIVNQTYKNLEIILVDDGSTDGSENLCDEYAKNDNRIKVIHQKNSGVSAARNRGIENVTGQFVHFPDSDDYLDLDAYDYLLKRHFETGCKVINFEHNITYSNKEIVHKFYDGYYKIVNKDEALRRIVRGMQFLWNKFFVSELLFSKPEVKFDEKIYRGEDTLFSVYVVDKVDNVLFDDKPLYHYVQSEESACRGKFRVSQLSALELYDAYKPILCKDSLIWNTFLTYNQLNLISIYYDMWDENPKKYLIEMKKVLKILREYYPLVISFDRLSFKEKVKFYIFNKSSNLFCIFHKISLLFGKG